MGTIEVSPRSKMYSARIQCSGKPVIDLRKRVVDCGAQIDQSAEYGISGIATPTRFRDVTLVGVTLADLDLPSGASNQEAWGSAARYGLVAPPQETALELVCTPGVNFSRICPIIVMSHAIQSRARASDSILLGVISKGPHRVLVGEVGAPHWRIASNMLLVFMEKQN